MTTAPAAPHPETAATHRPRRTGPAAPAHLRAEPGSRWSITGTWPDTGTPFVGHHATVAEPLAGEQVPVFVFDHPDDLNTASAHPYPVPGPRGDTADTGIDARHLTHATRLSPAPAAAPAGGVTAALF